MLSRYLAVNRRKHQSNSDSGVIRSTRVPNLKTPRGLVALWHRGIRLRHPAELAAGQASDLNGVLTNIVGRGQRLASNVPDMVHRLNADPISSREQMETSGEH